MTEKKKRNMEKRMIAYISEHHFLDALEDKFKITNLPEDALLVRAGYCIERQAIYVVIQSETFEEAKEGEILPLFMAECKWK